MESNESKKFKEQLIDIGRKQFWSQEGDCFLDGIIKRRMENNKPPESIWQSMNVELKEMNAHIYYELRPFQKDNGIHIFYLHGGAYVNRISQPHWDFVGRLAQATNATITVPFYPLAPEYTYRETFDFVYPLYVEQAKKVEKPKNMILMGDSAGGGLALALSQLLKQKKFQQPNKLILLSPWLDITLSNPEINSIDPLDPFLAKPGLIEAGKMYAGDTSTKNYLVSPLYGDLNGLADITLFMGTDDILAPDARKFVQYVKEQGAKIDYIEAPHMVHIYPIFTFPEGLQAFEQIVDKVKKHTKISG